MLHSRLVLVVGREPGLAEVPDGCLQRLQSEHGGQFVVAVDRASFHHLREFPVGQERTERLDRGTPSERLQTLTALARNGHLGLGRVEVFAAPLDTDRARLPFALDAQVDRDRRVLVAVEVAPSLPPVGRPVGPATGVTGHCELCGLRDRRLARAVAPDDEREPRPRLKAQLARRADATESGHRHRLQIGAHGRLPFLAGSFRPLNVRVLDDLVQPAQQRTEDQTLDHARGLGVRVEPVEHLQDERIVHSHASDWTRQSSNVTLPTDPR